MTNYQDVVERLSQFNNLSFTKKQWDIVLKGCGCPKSSHFWKALRQYNLVMDRRNRDCILYTLKDMDIHSFAIILDQYNTDNRANVMKTYKKAKARQRARERADSIKNTTFYMVGGMLTTEKPTIDR